MANLKITLDETRAVITHDLLPHVMGDPIQLIQLFQNLISNGIKFRDPDKRPEIHVSAEARVAEDLDRGGYEWVFSVRDNGIGIEQKYFDRIFVIFQRLHTREQYPGTGIGLALCKKIVERHGGRIWVESQEGKGSTFYFSLPKLEPPHES
jgi:light-regulated signal transduction histidine kinase (bacteriophytochrome)